jgi:hypothetical protein
LLFMIVAKHTTELCPGGKVRQDKDFMTKLADGIKESKVKLVGGYLDAPGHTFYFVINSDSNQAINDALEQLRLVGDVKIVPVLEFSEGAAWLKKTGIQR